MLREDESDYGHKIVSQVYARVVGSAAYFPKSWTELTSYKTWRDNMGTVAATCHDDEKTDEKKDEGQ